MKINKFIDSNAQLEDILGNTKQNVSASNCHRLAEHHARNGEYTQAAMTFAQTALAYFVNPEGLNDQRQLQLATDALENAAEYAGRANITSLQSTLETWSVDPVALEMLADDICNRSKTPVLSTLTAFQQEATKAIQRANNVPSDVASAYIAWADQIVPVPNQLGYEVCLELAQETEGPERGYHLRAAVSALLYEDSAPNPNLVKDHLKTAALYAGGTNSSDAQSLTILANGAEHLVRLATIHKTLIREDQSNNKCHPNNDLDYLFAV